MNSIAPRFSLFSMLIVAVAIPAAATVTVSSPVNNSQVESPFALAAVASTCSSQTVGAMGYSLDSSTDTIIVDGTKVEAAVARCTSRPGAKRDQHASRMWLSQSLSASRCIP